MISFTGIKFIANTLVTVALCRGRIVYKQTAVPKGTTGFYIRYF